ncbi:MAG: NrdH-redoxin [Candidatus Diapherotrites archaeon CG08_land_8_20_14_0_20_34_12]|nr:MAG: NrdH-redoxin [Candidatus Diapherotrites archaeon CG08_land_8_20_14_0_20_34_12]
MVKVIIYSTPTCPFCELVKKFLKENNIKYTEINLAKNKEKLKEMITKSGQTGVPVVDIDGKIIQGFNKVEMKKALHL